MSDTSATADLRRIALALASLAAAGIHFAVIGEHLEQGIAIGLFFATVAWLQALWAVGILVAPNRALLIGGLVGNAAVVAIWAISRTVGLPVGAEPWAAEPVGWADLLATALEAAIVIGSAIVLARPGARRPVRLIPAIAIGASLVVLTTAAIATGPEHARSDSEALGNHADVVGTDGVGDHTQPFTGGSGEPDLAQIELIRTAMRKYRDVKVAEAEGWHKEHPDWPELGAHFYRASDWAGSQPARPEVDPTDPEFLMYSRFLTGDWKLVAVAYVVDRASYPEPPATLTGAIYHEHRWNCIKDGEELEEEDWGVISKEECDVMGGRWSPGGVWMTHVWLVDNPNGIFAETNPTLDPLNTA